jgi:Flp pilus assembly pilin Flp
VGGGEEASHGKEDTVLVPMLGLLQAWFRAALARVRLEERGAVVVEYAVVVGIVVVLVATALVTAAPGIGTAIQQAITNLTEFITDRTSS